MFLLVLAVGGLALAGQAASLPDNPCDLLDPGTVSRIAGVQISEVRRAVGISEQVTAEAEHRQPRPGRICVYETPAPITSITVYVPEASARSAKAYWDQRAEYFKTYP